MGVEGSQGRVCLGVRGSPGRGVWDQVGRGVLWLGFRLGWGSWMKWGWGSCTTTTTRTWLHNSVLAFSRAWPKKQDGATFLSCLACRPLNMTGDVLLSVCPSVYLSVHLSVCPSICLSVHLSVCPSICPSVHLSVCLSIYLSVCPSVCPSVHPSVHPSICLSICLSVVCSLSSSFVWGSIFVVGLTSDVWNGHSYWWNCLAAIKQKTRNPHRVRMPHSGT